MQELSDSEEFELTDGEESDEFVLESDSSGSDEDEDDSTERFDNGVEDFSNEDPVTATRRLQQGCHAGVASIAALTALNDWHPFLNDPFFLMRVAVAAVILRLTPSPIRLSVPFMYWMS